MKTPPKSSISIWPAWLFAIATGLFALDAWAIQSGRILSFDTAVLHAIHRSLPDTLSSFFLVFTHLGGIVGVTVVTALLLAGFIRGKRSRAGGMLVGSVIGAALANLVLKSLFERMRPDLWQAVINEHGFSFPSGHAMVSSTLVFTLLYLTWQTRWRRWVLGVGLPLVFIISFSRLYFGVHYPSDVLGGWLFSLAWVGLIAGLANAVRSHRRSNDTA